MKKRYSSYEKDIKVMNKDILWDKWLQKEICIFEVLGGKQEDLRKAEEGFQSKLKEAHRKMESLLSSVMAEYSQFSRYIPGVPHILQANKMLN